MIDLLVILGRKGAQRRVANEFEYAEVVGAE